MKLTRRGLCLTVTREPTDPPIHSETSFWYALKKHVNTTYKQDCIKKLMSKDGHMVDDCQYYVRQRKWDYAIIDNHYALRAANTAFNLGSVDLHIVNWEFDRTVAFLQSIPETENA